MNDLTRGPIGRHLASMAAFIGAGMVFQSAYFIVDLYFVSRMGPDALAGVAASGNFSFLAIAAAQLVSVGALSLISQAIGRRDRPYADLVFHQVCGLALLMSLVMLVAGYALAASAAAGLGASPAASAFGRAYLYGYIPAMAAMFPGNAISSALRAEGIVRPVMYLQSASVILNAILAPILIAGWGTGYPLGAFGAGLASSISAIGSLAVIVAILPRLHSTLHVRLAHFVPRLDVWLSVMKVGLPASGEFFLMFVFTGVTYLCIRRFGADAQAGYGIGARVMQAMFVPVLAISFAASPIAGQNVGAGLRERVRRTFLLAAGSGTLFMLALTAFFQLAPRLLARPFTDDPAVLAMAVQYLRVISWLCAAGGVSMACSGMFQALGDTRPAFFSSASRLLTYVAPLVWLSMQPWASLLDMWRLSIPASFLQAGISLMLLRRSFRRRMPEGAGKPVSAARGELAQASAVP